MHPESEQSRIAAPSLPAPPQPYSFPVLATIAPVVVSIAIWLITRSVFALVFAALGPAVAVASLVDSRWQTRRRARHERKRFDREVVEVEAEIVAAHDRERELLEQTAPTAAAALRRVGHDPERFSLTARDAVLLTVGRARIHSATRLDGATPTARHESRAPFAARTRALADTARWLDAAPLRVDARLGIGVVGPPRVAAAIARALVVQARYLLSPREWAVRGDRPDPLAGDVAPAPVFPGSSTPVVTIDPSEGEPITIAVAATVDGLPPRVRVVISATEPAVAAVVRHPDRELVGPVSVETVAVREAHAFAAWLAETARQAGFAPGAGAVPSAVMLGELAGSLSDDRSGAAPSGELRAAFLAGADGPVAIDLVADGPHAVIGGTTGSGKSELLVAWVVALAGRYPPSHVAVLLVDFKGGASFAALEPLPHCVGMISDLDQSAALRALSSLTAEIRYRERVLSAAGARSIDELPTGSALPRLVIVVDEFAAMVTEFPELHALFADLAARGRSLGIHLVLCTQRPAGAVRDAVLANSGLRISLRVNNRADSGAVIGTDAAAALPARPPGRALVSTAGSPPVEVQVALAVPADAQRVARRWRAVPPPRRPWLEPLPTEIPAATLDALVEGSLPFARADLPAEQRQPTVGFSVTSDGHLLVIGAALSGKSTLLGTLATAAAAAGVDCRWVAAPHTDRGEGAEEAWDWAISALSAIRSSRSGQGETPRQLVLIDDLDTILDRLGDDHRAAFTDMLTSILREGAGAGYSVVLAVQRLVPALQSAVTLCDSRLVFRLPTRQEHLIAGGASDEFDPAAPPGSGHWRGMRIQVARSGVRPAGRTVTVDPAVRIGEESLAIVTTRPGELRSLAEAAGATVIDIVERGADPATLVVDSGQERIVVIGDPEAWNAHWGAVVALGRRVPVLFHACSTNDFRTLTRSRTLPPPIADPETKAILVVGGEPRRVVIAGAP